jgi:hypothetical protein
MGVPASDAPAKSSHASRRKALLGAVGVVTAATLATAAFCAADKSSGCTLTPLERRDYEHGYNQGRRRNLIPESRAAKSGKSIENRTGQQGLRGISQLDSQNPLEKYAPRVVRFFNKSAPGTDDKISWFPLFCDEGHSGYRICAILLAVYGR